MARRVVTGLNGNDKPSIVSDGEPPRSSAYRHTPGFAVSMVWTTDCPPAPAADPTPSVVSWTPGPGGTIAMTVTFPPDSVFAEPGFDPVAAGAEQLEITPGLSECFEPDNPGMHTTPTVDYGVVLSGEIMLDLDGESTMLRAGDIVVQNRTRHAWRNPGTASATVFFVLIGTGDA